MIHGSTSSSSSLSSFSRTFRFISPSQLDLHRPFSSPSISPLSSPRRLAGVSAAASYSSSTSEAERESSSQSNDSYGRRHRYDPMAMTAAPATTSLYELLGLTADATSQEIKAAYRKLARLCHPDVASVDRKDVSTDKFMRVHAAYSTLSDPEKRAEYDRSLLFISPNQRVVYGRSASFSGSSSPPRYSPMSGFTRKNWETDQCW